MKVAVRKNAFHRRHGSIPPQRSGMLFHSLPPFWGCGSKRIGGARGAVVSSTSPFGAMDFGPPPGLDLPGVPASDEVPPDPDLAASAWPGTPGVLPCPDAAFAAVEVADLDDAVATAPNVGTSAIAVQPCQVHRDQRPPQHYARHGTVSRRAGYERLLNRFLPKPRALRTSPSCWKGPESQAYRRLCTDVEHASTAGAVDPGPSYYQLCVDPERVAALSCGRRPDPPAGRRAKATPFSSPGPGPSFSSGIGATASSARPSGVGATASSVWSSVVHSCFRSRSPFGAFLRSVCCQRTAPAAAEAGRPVGTPTAAEIVWPMPPPYPLLWQSDPSKRARTRTVDAKRGYINLLVAFLSWLHLDRPTAAPWSCCLGRPLNSCQCATVARFEAGLSSWSHCPLVSAEALGRSSDKAQKLDSLLEAISSSLGHLTDLFDPYELRAPPGRFSHHGRLGRDPATVAVSACPGGGSLNSPAQWSRLAYASMGSPLSIPDRSCALEPGPFSKLHLITQLRFLQTRQGCRSRLAGPNF